MAKPKIVVVGADKGGVGKTTLSRAVLDYFKTNNVDVRAFDTEAPLGVLKGFYPEQTTIVDLTKLDQMMKVFDSLPPVTLIDVRAGLLTPTLKTLGETGFMDLVTNGLIDVVVLHVIGSSMASFNEIKAVHAALPGCKHFVVTNHISDAPFFEWDGDMAKLAFSVADGVLDIPNLNGLAVEHIESANRMNPTTFLEFIRTSKSLMVKGVVRHWLAKVFEQFGKAPLLAE